MSGDGVRTGTRPGSGGRKRVRFARARTRLRRFREYIRGRPLLDGAWRAGIFVAGWFVVLAGILMLVFPGPGWGSIFLGFAILATEFVWARRALRRAQRVAQGAANIALDPKVRRRNQILAVTLVAAAVLAVVLYLVFIGVPGIVPFVD